MRNSVASLACLIFASSAHAACNIVNGVAYGDCAGVTVNTGKQPFTIISDYRSINGISEGARVASGGSLSVSGIADRVIVDQGGFARITGIVAQLEISGGAYVSGSVGTVLLLNGGQVTLEGIAGMITGEGTATLVEGAVVSGVPISSSTSRSYSR